VTKPTLIRRCHEILGPLGFDRRGDTWNRAADQFVDVVNLQVSRDKKAVTLNGGVLQSTAYRTCWGEDAPTFVREEQCTVRTRSGRSTFGSDVWWSLNDEHLLSILSDSLTGDVIPFINKMHDPVDMEAYLEGELASKSHPYAGSIIYLASLKAQRGARGDACGMLREYLERVSSGWRERLMDAATRLGCAPSL
jgi:hypothetical protein